MTYSCKAMCIESPFPFISIHKMRLHARVNEHIRLELWGLLDSASAPALMREHFASTCLKVTLPDGRIYFTGLPMQIDMQEQNGSFLIYLSCTSASVLLDIHPRSRSFQDIRESYNDILKAIYDSEEHAVIRTGKAADFPIETPIFQYKETAWAFTLRMAGRLETFVIPDHREPYARVTIGETGGKPVELDDPDYTTGQNRTSGYFHIVQSVQQFALGDTVVHAGRRLVVVKESSVFENGAFDNSYVLGTEAGFAVKPHDLPLSGLRLRGTVLATSSETLKLHLDIDHTQDPDKAYWFDFVPQSGNVMYCMPQIGTKAMLRFCSNRDASCVAEECWRENGQACSALHNYHKRTYTSEFGEHLAMFPETLFFTGADNLVGLSDTTGILTQTNRRTEITAGERITFHAKKRTTVEVPQHIYITKPNTISVIDFAGEEINIESKRTGVSADSNAPTDKPYPASRVTSASTLDRGLAAAALGFAAVRSGKGAW